MADKQSTKAPQPPLPPISKWGPVVAVAWLIPGAGHFMLQRRVRAALLSGSVIVMFVFGLLMRGAIFEPQSGDLLTTVIYTGGYLANICSGILFLLTRWLGYDAVDQAGHVIDYGTKFLAAAGLLNVLAVIDAFEIAAGRKD